MKEMTVVASDGVKLAVELFGLPDKPVLMFSNSLGTDRNMWAPQLEHFADEFQILRYDTRGHGASDSPVGAYSIDRLALDAIEIMDNLDIAQVHFCGLSLGGMTGQHLCWRNPDRLASLILAATSAHMLSPGSWQDRIERVNVHGMASIFELTRRVWFTEAFLEDNPPILAQLANTFQQTDPGGYSGCCAAIRDMDQRRTARLNMVKTLVISGQHDTATPPSHGEYLASEMARAEFACIKAAHLLNVELPETFNNLAMTFIRGRIEAT